jgi:hypothetical protein
VIPAAVAALWWGDKAAPMPCSLSLILFLSWSSSPLLCSSCTCTRARRAWPPPALAVPLLPRLRRHALPLCLTFLYFTSAGIEVGRPSSMEPSPFSSAGPSSAAADCAIAGTPPAEPTSPSTSWWGPFPLLLPCWSAVSFVTGGSRHGRGCPGCCASERAWSPHVWFW